MWCEKLNRELVVPEGWFVVTAGLVVVGDWSWKVPGVLRKDPEGFSPVALYNWGSDVGTFWCVIRRFVDVEAGI